MVSICTVGKFVGADECLAEIHIVASHVQTLVVKTFHKVEVELALEVTSEQLIALNLVLEVSLLADKTGGIDTFVHSDGVLPVVAALGVLRVILDSHCLVGTHVLEHHFLLYASHLCAWSVLRISALAYSVRGEIAACASGITHGHCEVAFFISLQ